MRTSRRRSLGPLLAALLLLMPGAAGCGFAPDVSLRQISGAEPDSSNDLETNWWIHQGKPLDATFEPVRSVRSGRLKWKIWTDFCRSTRISWTVHVNDAIVASGELSSSWINDVSDSKELDWRGEVKTVRLQAQRKDEKDCKVHFIVEDFGVDDVK